jgi:hypothetical protein
MLVMMVGIVVRIALAEDRGFEWRTFGHYSQRFYIRRGSVADELCHLNMFDSAIGFWA